MQLPTRQTIAVACPDVSSHNPRPHGARIYLDMSVPAFGLCNTFVAAVLTTFAALFWSTLFDVNWQTYFHANQHLFLPLAAYIATVLAHEAIHAVASKLLDSNQRVYLAGLHRGMFVVRSEGLSGRWIYVTSLLAPFFFISILFPALVLNNAGEYAWLVVAVASANALLSSADVVLASATLHRAPRGCLVDGCGDELYFVARKTAPETSEAVESSAQTASSNRNTSPQ